MIAIYKKELRSYFVSPIGYIFVALFLAVSSLLFTYTTLYSGTCEVNLYFTFLLYIFAILIPLLTMRMLSEEKKMRTDQLLLTSPVTIGKIVMGKFLAALSMFVIGSLPLAAAACVMRFYGIAFTLETAGNFAGLLLAGAAFITIFLLKSDRCEKNDEKPVSETSERPL